MGKNVRACSSLYKVSPVTPHRKPKEESDQEDTKGPQDESESDDGACTSDGYQICGDEPMAPPVPMKTQGDDEAALMALWPKGPKNFKTPGQKIDYETASEQILYELSQQYLNKDVLAMYNKVRKAYQGASWEDVPNITKWIQALRSCTQLLNNDIRICLAFA